jgi:hypothetical protein
MRDRCKSPANYHSYHNYGGRGIKVCERWEASFDDFMEDMGPRPTPDHQLDRIDNEGDYEPGNCRWVTRKVNNNNRSTNRRITYKGVTKNLKEWADHLGVHDGTLHGWLGKGLTMSDIVAKVAERTE